MEKNYVVHPLWTGFLKLIRSICAIEIGIYLYTVWS